MCRALIALLLLSSSTAFAQLVPRSQHAVRGSYAVTGNALVDCPTTDPCDNNNTILLPVDADTVADSMASSSATLVLPAGAQVVAATLSLLAFGSETEAGGAQWLPSMDPLDYPVRFAGPDGVYTTVHAEGVRTGAALAGGGYEAHYDVTSLVTGGGEYWVADPVLPPPERPYNQNVGWNLVVVYEDGSAPQLVTLYEGGLLCFSNTSTAVFAGFRTPTAGTPSARMSIFAVDGHEPTPGDSISLGTLVLMNPDNPSTNIGNSSVSDAQGPIERNPAAFAVTESIDIDTFDVSTAFTNSQTSIVGTFICGSDGIIYYGAVLAMDVLLPDVAFPKAVTDVNGGDTVAGDELLYELRITVTGDDAVDVVLSDPIPDGATYVAGSIEVGTSSRTDAIGDDDAELAGGEIVVRLGTIQVGTPAVVRFRATVDPITAPRTIANLGTLTFRGAQAGSGLAALTIESSSPAGAGPTTIDVVAEGGADAGAPDADPSDSGSDDATAMDSAVDAGAIDSGSRPDSGAAVDAGGGDEDEGCDCSAASTSSSSTAWILLLALPLVRRRRS
jgi:MYXO-CTERM domain-containing protein/uncharacterized repeat protein (TIGR01451 family)